MFVYCYLGDYYMVKKILEENIFLKYTDNDSFLFKYLNFSSGKKYNENQWNIPDSYNFSSTDSPISHKSLSGIDKICRHPIW